MELGPERGPPPSHGGPAWPVPDSGWNRRPLPLAIWSGALPSTPRPFQVGLVDSGAGSWRGRSSGLEPPSGPAAGASSLLACVEALAPQGALPPTACVPECVFMCVHLPMCMCVCAFTYVLCLHMRQCTCACACAGCARAWCSLPRSFDRGLSVGETEPGDAPPDAQCVSSSHLASKPPSRGSRWQGPALGGDPGPFKPGPRAPPPPAPPPQLRPLSLPFSLCPSWQADCNPSLLLTSPRQPFQVKHYSRG